MKDIYPLGEMPPLGELPSFMYAQVIRQSRFGDSRLAYQIEKVEVPSPGPFEVIIYVMATGVNYNGVWAAMGYPLDVIQVRQRSGEPWDFHVGGSDCSGVVFAVGEGVTNVKVGDQVITHPGWWDPEDPVAQDTGDGTLSNTMKIWGYETTWGSFGQFAKAKAHQCLPKPKRLTWEAAACYMLVGSTAYRMLTGWAPHTVRSGDVVLVWGGAGGLGSIAIQLIKEMGGLAVVVVSSKERGEYCVELGAAGYLLRGDYDHWGQLPAWDNDETYGAWLKGAKAFGRALWDALGERKSPRIVFEHPGQDTLPTSVFVCDTGGMVVICAGTSGYNGTLDLRYQWMRQKRLQGSHAASNSEAAAMNQLVIDGKIDPCLSRTFSFDEIPLSHQLMSENRHPSGNMAALVGASRKGLKDLC